MIYVKVKIGRRNRKLPNKWQYHSGADMGEILDILKARFNLPTSQKDWRFVQISTCSEAEYNRNTHPQFRL